MGSECVHMWISQLPCSTFPGELSLLYMFVSVATLESRTRALIMTPPSIRRSMQAPGPGGGMYARPAPGYGEDVGPHAIVHVCDFLSAISPPLPLSPSFQLSQGEGDQDGSLSAPSEESEIDPLEKEWMLASSSADMEEIHTLMMRDSTIINRKDFLHGVSQIHVL